MYGHAPAVAALSFGFNTECSATLRVGCRGPLYAVCSINTDIVVAAIPGALHSGVRLATGSREQVLALATNRHPGLAGPLRMRQRHFLCARVCKQVTTVCAHSPFRHLSRVTPCGNHEKVERRIRRCHSQVQTLSLSHSASLV
jgi:hypothetical protein